MKVLLWLLAVPIISYACTMLYLIIFNGLDLELSFRLPLLFIYVYIRELLGLC